MDFDYFCIFFYGFNMLLANLTCISLFFFPPRLFALKFLLHIRLPIFRLIDLINLNFE